MKSDSKIFDMYRTGESNKGITTLRNRAYLLIPVILLPIGAFYYVLHMFQPPEEVETVKSINGVIIKDGNSSSVVAAVPDFYILEQYANYTNINGWLIDNKDKLISILMKQLHEKQIISKDYIILRFSYQNKTIKKFLASKELIALGYKNHQKSNDENKSKEVL